MAHALRRLPKIADAFASSRVSWDQLRPLTRFVTAETDEGWAARAPELRPAALWREARRHERIRVREAEKIHRERYLRLQWDQERPVLWLEGMLPAEQGAVFESAITRRAESVPRDGEALDPSGARLADALVDLATGEPQPATVVVHAGAEALARQEPEEGPGWPKRREDSGSPASRFADWPVTPGSSGSWSQRADRWGSAGGAGKSPEPSTASSVIATTLSVGSRGASGSGGFTPTT
jgi:hypothetical protein